MVFCLSLWPPRSDSCSFNERYYFSVQVRWQSCCCQIKLMTSRVVLGMWISTGREIPLAGKWRSRKQSWLITGQAGTLFICVTSLVLRGIRLVPRTCFSPQSRRGGAFDLVLAKRILRAEDKSDRVCSSFGRKTKTLHQLYSFVSSALFSSEKERS